MSSTPEEAPIDIGDRKHGTRPGYVGGCRCAPCVKSNAEYQREYMAKWREAQKADDAEA